MVSGNTRRVIAAGAIGNLLEWYDFAVYGYFAASIGRTFFPREDPVAQVLAAFGIFAVGYIMRPLGGALVGHIGDRFGRRTALTFSVAAMAIPTFLVGILPGHNALGVAAPIILTILRMIQGLSVGGEYTTSVIFMVERAAPGRRGLIGAVACCGAVAGILLGSATGAVLAYMMSEATLESWGWRIPFLLGILVGLAGYFLRRHMVEEPPASGSSCPPPAPSAMSSARSPDGSAPRHLEPRGAVAAPCPSSKPPTHKNQGSSGKRVGEFGAFQSAGSMQVRTLRRRYSSSRSP